MIEQLPAGWSVAALGELVAPIEVIDPRQRATEKFFYIDIGSIDNTSLLIGDLKEFVGSAAPSRARRLVRTGDVLFSTVRPYLRNIAMAGPEHDGCLTSTGITVLRSGGRVLPEYVFRFVATSEFVERVARSMDGTLYPAVRDADVFKEQIPLPPLTEQRRIVARIEALFARTRRARADLERITPLAASYRQKTLEQTFAGVANDREAVPLGSLLTAIEAGKNMRCEERRPRPGEAGIVKISAVTWGHFDPTAIKTAPARTVLDPRSRITNGDFLISRANTLELVGAPVIAQNVPPDTFLSDKVLRLCFREPVDRWVLWFLRSPGGRREIEARSSGNQLSMRNIGQGALREIPVPLLDADSRARTIAAIENGEERTSAANREADRALILLARLEQSFLARAFRGELVRQNAAEAATSLKSVARKRLRATDETEGTQEQRSNGATCPSHRARNRAG